MLICEVDNKNSDDLVMTSLGTFLAKRIVDVGAQKPLDVNSFINMAKDNGLNLSQEKLEELIKQEPLSNIIDRIEGSSIFWKNADQPSLPASAAPSGSDLTGITGITDNPEEEPYDTIAKDTVRNMANRAIRF